MHLAGSRNRRSERSRSIPLLLRCLPLVRNHHLSFVRMFRREDSTRSPLRDHMSSCRSPCRRLETRHRQVRRATTSRCCRNRHRNSRRQGHSLRMAHLRNRRIQGLRRGPSTQTCQEPGRNRRCPDNTPRGMYLPRRSFHRPASGHLRSHSAPRWFRNRRQFRKRSMRQIPRLLSQHS